MRAGNLDRRLSLRHLVLGTQGAAGDYPDQSYTEYAEVWGGKQEISGREFFAAQQKDAERTVRFTIRHRTDMLSTDRIVCEGIDYDITHIAEVGRREGLHIFARAIVP
jgi:SPP1 family predicted phage head-tail adaptor